MASHRVVTRTQRPDGWFWERDELVDYGGAPDWKFEPLDPVARAQWEQDYAQPERADDYNQRQSISGCFREDESPVPPGGVPKNIPVDYGMTPNGVLPAGTLPPGWGQPHGMRS